MHRQFSFFDDFSQNPPVTPNGVFYPAVLLPECFRYIREPSNASYISSRAQKLRNNPHKSKTHVFKMVFQFYKVHTDNLCHHSSFKITTNRLGIWENLFRRFVRPHYVKRHRKPSKIHCFPCYSLTILFVERIARSVRWEINGNQ